MMDVYMLCSSCSRAALYTSYAHTLPGLGYQYSGYANTVVDTALDTIRVMLYPVIDTLAIDTG